MIIQYEDKYEKAWDRFVLQESINGTFLHTRRFINYHPKERFIDNSLLYLKGTNIAAVIPACIIEDNEKKKFVSHAGSTFGGIVLGKQYKKISEVQIIYEEFEEYLCEYGFGEVTLKQTSNLFQKEKSDLIDYFMFINNYVPNYEVGYYIDYSVYDDDILKNFTASKRRDYKYSLKNQMEFKQLISDDEVQKFYFVLENNMKKFDIKPLHTVAELLEFKNERLKEEVAFFGVFFEGELIAGAMVFFFGKEIFHTQYIATDQSKLKLFPNEFLYYSLISEAKKEGFRYLSFGTSTLEHGKVLNQKLAQFKEGFGTAEYINCTYYKTLRA